MCSGGGKASFQNLYPGDVSVCNGSCWIITSTLEISDWNQKIFIQNTNFDNNKNKIFSVQF